MTREDKDSLVEMLSKIPITETKGSLLSAIGRLLRVIDISESSIMIPTLLKDQCEFDAYEMLTLAKILKASILGHNDLVEFYMSESSSQQIINTTLAQQQHQHQHQQQLQLSIQSASSNSSSGGSSSSNTSSTNGNIPSSRQQYNHQYQLQQLSATPSLRSSLSESTATSVSASSPASTPLPRAESSLGSGGNVGCGGSNRLYSSPRLTGGHNNNTSSSSITNHNHHNHHHHHHHHHHHNNHHHNHHHFNQKQKQQQQLALLGNNGDPDATVRLLLQIEQLKTFIPQVTGIFESIIELYKNSVDTITYGK